VNKLYWVGIIVWGLFVTGCGLTSAGAGEAQQPQDVMFLLAGGLLTSLVGLVGLCGFMGWMGRAPSDKKSYL
jgi:hypothetical protein